MTESTYKETPVHHTMTGSWSYASETAPTTWFTTNLTKTNNFVGSVSGEKNPDWKRQVRAHVSATTPSSGVMYSISSAPTVGEKKFWTHPTYGNFRYRRWYKVAGVYLRHPPSFSPPSLPTSGSGVQSADNLAIARLYDRLATIQSRVQSGEDFGEWRSTLRLIRRPFRQLAQSSSALLQRQIKAFSRRGVKEVAKALADTTLEWRFGVKPLVQTCADAFVGLQNRDNVEHYVQVYASGRTFTSSNTLSNDSYGLDPSELMYNEFREQEQVVRYTGEWRVASDLPKRAVSDVLGLNWRNVVPTLYNLIPYSFLVDYVTNIGDIVNSLAVPWHDVAWMNKTIRHSYLVRQQTVGWSRLTPPYYRVESLDLTPGFIEIRKTAFERLAQGSMPYPKIQLQMPSYKQVQNIASLLVSRLTSKSGKIKKAMSSRPGLESAFADEVGKRNLRIPYPFH